MNDDSPSLVEPPSALPSLASAQREVLTPFPHRPSDLSNLAPLVNVEKQTSHIEIATTNGQNNAQDNTAFVQAEVSSMWVSSLSELVLKYNLILPKPRDDWRLIQEPVQGEINGIPSMRGFCLATNGIIVAILTQDSKIIFGHLPFFVPDREEELAKVMNQPKTKKATKKEEDFFKLFEGI